MEEKRNVFSDEVAIKIVDSVKEIILPILWYQGWRTSFLQHRQ